MEKTVYHGSPNPDLKELTAHRSTHQKKCIYATDNLTVALLFMGKGQGDLDTRISTVDGSLELLERRPGILKSLYDKEGYLYELNGSTFEHYDYLWSQEVISFEPSITPQRVIRIPNVMEALMKEESKGNIKIYQYPDRPENVPLDNSDLIDTYIRYENSGLHGAVEDLLKIYPEFTDEVNKRLQSPKEKQI